METSKVALRYCGGCNPRFERKNMVEALQVAVPSVQIEPFRTGEDYRAVLVICGCSARCAEQRDLSEGIPRFVGSSTADYEKAAVFLGEIGKEG